MSSSPSPAPDLASAPPLATRAVSGFGTSIGSGAALGLLAWVADQLGYPLGALLAANHIGTWLGLAFLLGASARTVPTGALRGVIGLLSAVVGYYLLTGIFGEGFRAIGASHAATVWGVVALVAGPVMGAAGGTWRHHRGWPRALAVALLAAALIAEGLAFQTRLVIDPVAWLTQFDASNAVLSLEALLGLALPALALGRGERTRGYAATLGVTVVAILVVGPVSGFVRTLADRF